MSRFERGFHSLAAIQERAAPRLVFDPEFSHVSSTANLVFNIRGIQKRMDLAGIRNMTVEYYAGPVSQFTQVPLGIKGRKELKFATRKSTSPPYSTRLTPVAPLDSPAYIAGRWHDARVSVNVNEVARIIRDKGKPQNSPSEWAKWMHKALTNRLHVPASWYDVSYSSERDFFPPTTDRRNAWINAGIVVASGATAYLLKEADFTFPAIILALTASKTVEQVINRIDYARSDYPTPGFRWSVTPSEYDKMVQLLVLQGKKLVKASSE